MIENYADKKKKKLVDLEFAESGSIAILERRFDALTGIPTLAPTTETSSKHIEDLLLDIDNQIKPLGQRRADLLLIQQDVKKKEEERDKLKTKMEKTK